MPELAVIWICQLRMTVSRPVWAGRWLSAMTTMTVQLVTAQDPDEARTGYGDPGDLPPGTSHVSPVRYQSGLRLCQQEL